MPQRFDIYVVFKRRYINTHSFLAFLLPRPSSPSSPSLTNPIFLLKFLPSRSLPRISPSFPILPNSDENPACTVQPRRSPMWVSDFAPPPPGIYGKNPGCRSNVERERKWIGTSVEVLAVICGRCSLMEHGDEASSVGGVTVSRLASS